MEDFRVGRGTRVQQEVATEPDERATPGRQTRAEQTGVRVPRLDLRRTGGLGHHLDNFAERFNREFAAQLHVFSTEPSPASASAESQSGTGLAGAQIEHYFTARQIQLLDQFMSASHPIPDRLFNGDEVGHTTAQQRIVLSAHILATGELVVGSITQRLHARMCGHWAALVTNYAGAAPSDAGGIQNEVDPHGNLSLTVADGEAGPTQAEQTQPIRATSTRASRDAAVQYQQQGIPMPEYANIQAGDWLYIYNANGQRGGNHSIIFSRWASEERTYDDGTPEGVPYRLAVTMSQYQVARGGEEAIEALGAHMIRMAHGEDSGRTIHPITRVARSDATTRPVQSVDDVVAMLGSDDEAAANRAYIVRVARVPAEQFDWSRLAEHIRHANEPLIAALGNRVTDQQRALLQQTNARMSPEGSEGLIGMLVRLNERLRVLGREAELVRSGLEEGRREVQVEATHDAEEARLAPRREEKAQEIEEHREMLEDLRRTLQGAHDAYEGLEMPEELRAARRRRDELLALLRTLPHDREHRDDRAAHLDELRGVLATIQRLDRAHQARRRELRRAERQAAVPVRRAERRESQLEAELLALVSGAGYHLAAGGIGGRTFQGVGEARVTGLVRNLQPAPNWSASDWLVRRAT